MKLFSKSIAALAMALVAMQATAFQAVEGKDYRVVSPSVATSEESIEVVDFFAYTCGHCQRFAPMLEEWIKEQPADVIVRRVPVAWEPATQFLSRIYYTFEALNRVSDLHPVFWQDILSGKITSEADLQNWLLDHNVDLKQWNAAYSSFAVTMHTQQALQAWQNYQLDATPYIAVAGKYLTAPHMAGSRQKTIKVLDWLIERERQQRQKQ